MEGAFYTGKYRNFFEEQGYNSEEITSRLEKIFQTIFYGPDDERFYHESGSDMGYLEDTGNHDVRTEGMSYGMMVCVQMNKQKEFDRLWKWVCTYMRIQEGPGKNYFIWSCGTDGTPNADGPAPDGEEFFAMALFFAANRWGDREGIFDYSGEARKILRECIHKGEPGHSGEPMWNRDNKLIKFIPGVEFTDPSYHLPHFYELFMKKIECFGGKQRETAGYSCIWPAIRTQDSHRNMRNTTASPTQVRKLSLDVMTGITATHTGLWQISAWMHFGSIGIRGRKKLQKGCRNFTV